MQALLSSSSHSCHGVARSGGPLVTLLSSGAQGRADEGWAWLIWADDVTYFPAQARGEVTISSKTQRSLYSVGWLKEVSRSKMLSSTWKRSTG